MGKGDRRNKVKQKPLSLPGLAPTPRPKKRGKARMTEIAREQDPQRVVLSARARMMGKENTVQNRSDMRTQALGEAAGRAIYLACDEDEAAKLWDVYAGLTATEARYSRLVLGKSLHAKCAKIEMMPERFETREDDSPDLRSEDERHRDAVNAWARWRGYIGHLHSHQQNAIWAIARDRVQPLSEAKLTQPGRLFVEALRALAEVVDGA